MCYGQNTHIRPQTQLLRKCTGVKSCCPSEWKCSLWQWWLRVDSSQPLVQSLHCLRSDPYRVNLFPTPQALWDCRCTNADCSSRIADEWKCVLCFFFFYLKVGFKPAGGIRKAKEAITWLMLVKEELGVEWLTPELFRLGASSLLEDIEKQVSC